jgi:hypothetical protein
LWYFLTTAVYAALGGVVALTLPAVTLWGALYAGISTPVLISTAAKHRESKIVEAANERRMRDNIIKASDHSSMAFELSIPKVSRLKTFVEIVRNHADGLFE